MLLAPSARIGWGAWGPPQDIPDLAVQAEDATEPVEQHRAEEWQLACAGFVDGSGWEDIKLTKIQRVAGMKHLLAWDNALRAIGVEHGLAAFVADPTQCAKGISDLPLLDSMSARPPSITFALDQGPQSFPTVFYMAYALKLHVFWHYDASHRLWNDVKDALAETGNWGFVCISTLAMNLDFGPWDGSEFFHRSAEALRHFVANGSSSHPLFSRFVAEIAADDGLEDGGLLSSAQRQELFQSLASHRAWSRKSVRVALCRWFGWLDAAERFLETWHVRLLTYLWVCVISGYGGLIDHELMQGRSEAPLQEASAADAEPMSRSNQRIETLRGRCRNTLHLTAGWMADSSNREFLQAIVHLVRPLREWHGAQNKAVRSPVEAREFFIECARGGGLKPLDEMMQSFRNSSSLEAFGFRINYNPNARSPPADLEFDLREEASLAQRLVHIAFALAKHRIMSMTHYMYSFPGAFVLALSREVEDQGWLLAWMKSAWGAFQAFEESGLRNTRFWCLIDQRSVMRIQVCRSFFRQGVASGFSRFDDVQRQIASDLFEGLCQTKVIEDTVHAAKEAEQFESRNGLGSSKSKWIDPIKAKILCQTHRYTEVAPVDGGLTAPASRAQDGLPQGLFEPTRKMASLGGISEHASASSPSWPTFSGRSMCKVVADMFLLDACFRSPTGVTLGYQAGFALFLNRGLLVRKRDAPQAQFFVVGQMYYVSILVPAAEVQIVSGVVAYGFSELVKSNLVFQVVLDLDDWEATPIEWASPLILARRYGRSVRNVGLVALPTGPSEGVLKAAARHCFWGITSGALDLALDQLGMSKPSRVFDKIIALLQRLLGPLSDEELLKLLRRRLNTSDESLKGLLAADGVAEELGKQDVAMVKETSACRSIRRRVGFLFAPRVCGAFLVSSFVQAFGVRTATRVMFAAGLLMRWMALSGMLPSVFLDSGCFRSLWRSSAH